MTSEDAKSQAPPARSGETAAPQKAFDPAPRGAFRRHNRHPHAVDSRHFPPWRNPGCQGACACGVGGGPDHAEDRDADDPLRDRGRGNRSGRASRRGDFPGGGEHRRDARLSRAAGIQRRNPCGAGRPGPPAPGRAGAGCRAQRGGDAGAGAVRLQTRQAALRPAGHHALRFRAHPNQSQDRRSELAPASTSGTGKPK